MEIFLCFKFVDFKMGSDSGYIRYEEPEAAQKARAAAVLSEQGGLAVKNFIATLEPVTGQSSDFVFVKFIYRCSISLDVPQSFLQP